MYSQDHAPPHFHAKYSGHDAAITIEDLRVANGEIPTRAERMVLRWASIHRDELMDAWNSVMSHESPGKIDPLP